MYSSRRPCAALLSVAGLCVFPALFPWVGGRILNVVHIFQPPGREDYQRCALFSQHTGGGLSTLCTLLPTHGKRTITVVHIFPTHGKRTITVVHISLPTGIHRCTHGYTPEGYTVVHTVTHLRYTRVVQTVTHLRDTRVAYTHCYTPREAPWWVLYTPSHIGRHPGGY